MVQGNILKILHLVAPLGSVILSGYSTRQLISKVSSWKASENISINDVHP